MRDCSERSLLEEKCQVSFLSPSFCSRLPLEKASPSFLPLTLSMLNNSHGPIAYIGFSMIIVSLYGSTYVT